MKTAGKKNLNIRVTEKLYNDLQQTAEQNHISLASLVRIYCVKGLVRDTRDDAELAALLMEIGDNYGLDEDMGIQNGRNPHGHRESAKPIRHEMYVNK